MLFAYDMLLIAGSVMLMVIEKSETLTLWQVWFGGKANKYTDQHAATLLRERVHLSIPNWFFSSLFKISFANRSNNPKVSCRFQNLRFLEAREELKQATTFLENAKDMVEVDDRWSLLSLFFKLISDNTWSPYLDLLPVMPCSSLFSLSLVLCSSSVSDSLRWAV